jgi:hypothetical protein
MEDPKIKKYAACGLKSDTRGNGSRGRFGSPFVKLLHGTFRDPQGITDQTLTAAVARANASIITKAAAMRVG